MLLQFLKGFYLYKISTYYHPYCFVYLSEAEAAFRITFVCPCLRTNTIFSLKRDFCKWKIMLPIPNMFWKVRYKAADEHTGLRIQFHVSGEICKMQISKTSKGGPLLSCIIKTASYLDDCMQNFFFLGEHQRKQLNQYTDMFYAAGVIMKARLKCLG